MTAPCLPCQNVIFSSFFKKSLSLVLSTGVVEKMCLSEMVNYEIFLKKQIKISLLFFILSLSNGCWEEVC